MKRSIRYATGKSELLRSDEITNIPLLAQYIRQELGVAYPVGEGRREAWFKFCKKEMHTCVWSIEDMVAAVRYIKKLGRPIHTMNGVFYYVDEALKYWGEQERTLGDAQLHTKVADALRVETSEKWRRRLSLAKGQALRLVYESWEAERLGGHRSMEGDRDLDRPRGDVRMDGNTEGGDSFDDHAVGIKDNGLLHMEA